MRAVLLITAVFVLSVVFWPETGSSPSPRQENEEEEFRRFESEYLKNLRKNPPQTAGLPSHPAD